MACHPTEESVAVGDNTGRVIVYQNVLSQNYQWAHFVYHWHTLPVNDVVFSPSGNFREKYIDNCSVLFFHSST